MGCGCAVFSLERTIMDSSDLNLLADSFAFIGNSLLSPMSQTEKVGLNVAFWESFPDFGSAEVERAIDGCEEFALNAQKCLKAGEDVVQDVSVEYTRLFIGPPSPTAPPWETFYRGEDVSVGFGQATFEMQDILRGLGLEVSNENNQYADHMGLELLTLSEMLRLARSGERDMEQVRSFAEEHPGSWIDAFCDSVKGCFPDGYYAALLALANALLCMTIKQV